MSEVRWVDDEIIDEVRAWGMEIEDASDVALEALRPRRPIDRAADVARDELIRVMPGLPEDALVKFQNRLRNSGKFRKLFPKSVTASG